MEKQTESKNLMDGLLEEMDRVQGILNIYKETGPSGIFACMELERAINRAKRAISSNDIVELLSSYGHLKGYEL